MVKRLAEKYNGIACEENYHNVLLSGLDRDKFPCLTYTRDLQYFLKRFYRNISVHKYHFIFRVQITQNMKFQIFTFL